MNFNVLRRVVRAILLLWCTTSQVFADDTLPSILTLKDDVFWLQNTQAAIYEGDTFSIFNFDYAYATLYIDELKLRPQQKSDVETEQMLRVLMHHREKEEVFVNTYAVPAISAGKHALRISLAKEKNDDDTAYPVALIRINLHCTPVPLLFFKGETCACTLDQKSVRLIQRPKWLARILEDRRKQTSE